MATSPLATAADYADAMMAARRAKNWLFLLLLVTVLGQITIFLLLRHYPSWGGESLAMTTATTEPATTAPSRFGISVPEVMEYLVAVTSFVGVALSLVLAVVLLLLITIMLVGRLIGVSQVTGAFLRCLVLIVLLFPWQSLLLSPVTTSRSSEHVTTTDFKIPGALYTWAEVTHPRLGATFSTSERTTFVVMRWARFVVFPLAALVLLLIVQSKGSRGLRMALGEVEFDVAEGAPAE